LARHKKFCLRNFNKIGGFYLIMMKLVQTVL